MNERPRILLVDDNVAIHEDFHAILGGSSVDSTIHEISKLEEELFGEENIQLDEDIELSATETVINYLIDDAYQGEDAITKVTEAAQEGNPYSLIFMDVRMPPGIDGIQTIKKIWAIHPDIEVVICTAFSDYSWTEIIKTLGDSSSLLIVKKPFDSISIKQTALTLTKKWQLTVENKQHLYNLEHQVKSRTQELEELVLKLKHLKSAAEESSAEKSKFLSTMSHELRTPLNGIIGMAELLQSTQMDEEQVDYCETIVSSGHSLLSVINDVLDYSKLEAQKLDIIDDQPFNLHQTIERIANLLSNSANKKDIELICAIAPSLPQVIIGDGERIGQIITNLLTNSIKFTNQGAVSISAEMLSQANKHYLIVKVRDTGIGIADDKMKYLFQPFSQPDASISRKYGGTGLGLSIAKQLCQLMNGDIYVKSQEYKGSIFGFKIPIPNTLPTSPQPNKNLPAPYTIFNKQKVAIIGHNPYQQKPLESTLKSWNLQPTFISTKSIYKDLSFEFSVIIIDDLDDKTSNYAAICENITDIFNRPSAPKDLKSNRPRIITLQRYQDPQKNKEPPNLNIYKTLLRPYKLQALNTTICELLNIKNHEQHLPKSPTIQLPDFSGCKVLLADDNKVNQKLLSKLLEKTGIKADIANDGKEVYDCFSNRNYDIILMDVHMPEIDGIQATKMIRKSNQKNSQLPIIAITADIMQDNKEHCIEAGMDAFISKPFRLDEVISVLAKYIHINQVNISSYPHDQ